MRVEGGGAGEGEGEGGGRRDALARVERRRGRVRCIREMWLGLWGLGWW